MVDIEKSFDEQPVTPMKAAEDEDGELGVDVVAEKKLVRKLDFYLIPVVMLLYLLSFLDR